MISAGKRFGRWVVVGAAEPDHRGLRRYLCRCDCGTERPVLGTNLRRSRSKGCDLCAPFKQGTAARKHGASDTPEHRIWRAMKSRCLNPNTIHYSRYGGRGIRVCDRWHDSFEAFYADMGPRPSERHSLDRFPDNDGNYEPGNCRWATDAEQSVNRSNNALVTFGGETKTVHEWAEINGVSEKAIRARLKRGWEPGLAVSTPTRRMRAGLSKIAGLIMPEGGMVQ